MDKHIYDIHEEDLRRSSETDSNDLETICARVVNQITGLKEKI